MKAKISFKIVFPLLLISLLCSPLLSAKANAANIITTQIRLSTKVNSLVSGHSFALKVLHLTTKHSVQFKSTNTSIAKVDKKGIVTGIRPGKATIKVTIKYGRKKLKLLKCTIKVGPPAISVVLTRNNITLVTGRKNILKAIVKPNNSTEKPHFSSSDTSVVAVNDYGQITALSIGNATITASIENGKFDTCLVTVIDPENETEDEPEDNYAPSIGPSSSPATSYNNISTNDSLTN